MSIFQHIDPQPARGKLKEAMWESQEYVAEEKLDGIRQVGQFVAGDVRFTGRRESVKGGLTERSAQVPHLSGVGCPPEWRNANVVTLDGTILDGEMCLNAEETARVRAADPTGAMSKEVQSILNSGVTEAVRKQQERGWLRYVVFDCLAYKGQDLRDQPYRVRTVAMLNALTEWDNHYAIPCQWVDGHKREFYERVLSEGGEGIILKHRDALYGQRTKWIKVKGTWTADVVIIGYQAAEKESVKVGDTVATPTQFYLDGLIGAVVVGQYLDGQMIEVATISGMSLDLRTALSRNGEAYIGRVVTIKHNGREPTGRFRHPRWGHWRTDKPADCCIYDENET